MLMAQAKAALLADQPYSIDDAHRLITVASIDGKGPFTFLIDTACSHTLIYEHVRAKLGLSPSKPGAITVFTINHSTVAVPVTPQALAIGDEKIPGLTIGVLPDAPDSQAEPDGILGIDVLSHYLVVLDRVNLRLKLYSADTDTHVFRAWNSVGLYPHPLKGLETNFWYLATRFNDIHFTTLFDLGAGVTLLNWQAAEKLGLRESDFDKLPSLRVGVRDVLGSDSPAIRVRGLTVGAHDQFWGGQYALVSDASVFDHFNLDEKPAAIVGPGLLRDNSLAIDFVGERLYVGPQVLDNLAHMRSGHGEPKDGPLAAGTPPPLPPGWLGDWPSYDGQEASGI